MQFSGSLQIPAREVGAPITNRDGRAAGRSLGSRKERRAWPVGAEGVRGGATAAPTSRKPDVQAAPQRSGVSDLIRPNVNLNRSLPGRELAFSIKEIASERDNFPALCPGVIQHLLCPFRFTASSYGSTGELLQSKKRRVCVCQVDGGQNALSRRSFAVCFAPPPFDVFFLSAIAASPPPRNPPPLPLFSGKSDFSFC